MSPQLEVLEDGSEISGKMIRNAQIDIDLSTTSPPA